MSNKYWEMILDDHRENKYAKPFYLKTKDNSNQFQQ